MKINQECPTGGMHQYTIYPKQLNHVSGILLKQCMLNANGLFSLILGQNSITLYLQIYLTTFFEIYYNDIYSKVGLEKTIVPKETIFKCWWLHFRSLMFQVLENVTRDKLCFLT